MSVERIRQALTQIRSEGRKIKAQELDTLLVQARDGVGLDPAEKAELLNSKDLFDDSTLQRLDKHLTTVSQKNAWVNLQSTGKVSKVEGRYATLSTEVPGLTAKLGLFDNTYSLKGKARADGELKLTIEGKDLKVPVQAGDTGPMILNRLQAMLPPELTGHVFGGDVKPFDMETYEGRVPRGNEQGAHICLYKPAALGLQPGEKPLRVVVTGYGRFMGIEDNASARMAAKLATAGVPGGIVEYRKLDVNPGAVDAFMAEMKTAKPDVILSMGVAPDKAQVEEHPQNYLAANVDGDNNMMTARPIVPGGAPRLNTDLPVATIDAALQPFGGRREVGTSLSDRNYSVDESAYLCNYLGYNLASAFGTTPATTAGFFHITAHTPEDQMGAVLKAVVARQLDWRRTQEGPQVPRS